MSAGHNCSCVNLDCVTHVGSKAKQPSSNSMVNDSPCSEHPKCLHTSTDRQYIYNNPFVMSTFDCITKSDVFADRILPEQIKCFPSHLVVI